MVRAISRLKAIPVQEVSNAIQNFLNSITTIELDFFSSEKERWIKISKASPQITEAVLTLRLAEIERDRRFFGDANPAVLIEGLSNEGLHIRCLIGERYFIASYSSTVSEAERNLPTNVFSRLESILSQKIPSLEFGVLPEE